MRADRAKQRQAHALASALLDSLRARRAALTCTGDQGLAFPYPTAENILMSSAQAPKAAGAQTGARVAFGVFTFLFVILPVILGALDTVRLQCDRRSGEVYCQYTQHLLGVQRVARTIEHVRGAKLGVSVSRKGNSRTYRPELLTAKGETPLHAYTYNEALHKALVDGVNDFIASSAPTLQIEQPGWGRLFVACMALGWVVIVLFLRRLGAVS